MMPQENQSYTHSLKLEETAKGINFSTCLF